MNNSVEDRMVGLNAGDLPRDRLLDAVAEQFSKMGSVPDEQISCFFEEFASRLEDESIWKEIQSVNEGDVVDARARGRHAEDAAPQDIDRRQRVLIRRGQGRRLVSHQLVWVAAAHAAFDIAGKNEVVPVGCRVRK